MYFVAVRRVVAVLLGLVGYSYGYDFAIDVQFLSLGYDPFFLYRDIAIKSCFVGGLVGGLVVAVVLWDTKALLSCVAVLAVITVLLSAAKTFSVTRDIGFLADYSASIIGFFVIPSLVVGGHKLIVEKRRRNERA